MFRKICSFIVCAALVISVLPFTVSATKSNTFDLMLFEAMKQTFNSDGSVSAVSPNDGWKTYYKAKFNSDIMTGIAGYCGIDGHPADRNSSVYSGMCGKTPSGGYIIFKVTAPDSKFFANTFLVINARNYMSTCASFSVSESLCGDYTFVTRVREENSGRNFSVDISEYVSGYKNVFVKVSFPESVCADWSALYSLGICGEYADKSVIVPSPEDITVFETTFGGETSSQWDKYIFRSKGITYGTGIGGFWGHNSSWHNANICENSGIFGSGASVVFRVPAQLGFYFSKVSLLINARDCNYGGADFSVAYGLFDDYSVVASGSDSSGKDFKVDVSKYISGHSEIFIKAEFPAAGCNDWGALFSLHVNASYQNKGVDTEEKSYNTVILFDGTSEESSHDTSYIYSQENMQVICKEDMGNQYCMCGYPAREQPDYNGRGTVTYLVKSSDGGCFDDFRLSCTFRALIGSKTTVWISGDGANWTEKYSSGVYNNSQFTLDCSDTLSCKSEAYIRLTTDGSFCNDWAAIFSLIADYSTVVHTHEYGDYVTVTEPSCLSEGLRAKYCKCGASLTEKLPKTSHVRGKTVKTDGRAVIYCKNCRCVISNIAIGTVTYVPAVAYSLRTEKITADRDNIRVVMSPSAQSCRFSFAETVTDTQGFEDNGVFCAKSGDIFDVTLSANGSEIVYTVTVTRYGSDEAPTYSDPTLLLSDGVLKTVFSKSAIDIYTDDFCQVSFRDKIISSEIAPSDGVLRLRTGDRFSFTLDVFGKSRAFTVRVLNAGGDCQFAPAVDTAENVSNTYYSTQNASKALIVNAAKNVGGVTLGFADTLVSSTLGTVFGNKVTVPVASSFRVTLSIRNADRTFTVRVLPYSVTYVPRVQYSVRCENIFFDGDIIRIVPIADAATVKLKFAGSETLYALLVGSTETVTLTSKNKYSGEPESIDYTLTFDSQSTKNGWVNEGAYSCYYVNGKKLSDEWRIIDGVNRYFKKNGNVAQGFTKIDMDYYYFYSDGKLADGQCTINGVDCLFVHNKLFRGWNGKKYYDNSGAGVKNRFMEIDGTQYWFDASGDSVRRENDAVSLALYSINNPTLIYDIDFTYDKGVYTSLAHPYITGKTLCYTVGYNSDVVSNVLLEGNTVESGTVTAQASGNMTLAVWLKNGSCYSYTVSMQDISSNIPAVSIVTDDSLPITSKDEYKTAKIAISGSEKTLKPIEVNIKGRGNSSWTGAPKKSYRLKFNSKQSILDLGKAKSWTLIANYFDKSLMRNYIAYMLASELHDEFEPRMRFVDLYLNRNYEGTYCMCDYMQVNSIRLNLDESEEPDTGFFMEIDCRFAEEGGEIGVDGVMFGSYTVSIKDPEPATREQVQFLSDYLSDVYTMLRNRDSSVWDYIDMDSFVDWIMVNEVFKNQDACYLTSCYMFKDKGGKLFMGPVWDFDIGAGNCNYNGNDTPNGWWITKSGLSFFLFRFPEFSARFRERFEELRAGELSELDNMIDEAYRQVLPSALRNFERWDILGSYVWPNSEEVLAMKDYPGQVSLLKNWLYRRITWMSQNIQTL